MTVSEELEIIYKRIPEQKLYLAKLYERWWIWQELTTERYLEIHNSASGVLHNLRNRLQYLKLKESYGPKA